MKTYRAIACADCGQETPAGGARQKYCADCRAARKKEQHRTATRMWARRNYERVHAQTQQWRRDNPERNRQWSREYYVKNRDKMIASVRAYQIRNPEVGLAVGRKRRQLMKQAESRVITDRDWRRLWDRFNGLCAYCGWKPAKTVDHVIPLSRGGRHTIGNVVPCCSSCNPSKGDRFVMEWRRAQGR